MIIEKYIDAVSGEELKRCINYNRNGVIEREYYYLNDKLHREDGPASIFYYQDGKVRRKIYWVNNKRHRKNGPTIISYNKNGSIKEELYYLNDIECDILQEMVIRGLETK